MREEREFRLEDFGVDLCSLARAGGLDPIAGRTGILARMLQVLARKTKRNPLLLGEPGVGKSALVEGLAQLIVEGAAPAHLRDHTIFSLDLGSLVAGTSCRGDFEQRLGKLLAELGRSDGNRVLFIDEIHLLDRAGKSEGGLDAANALKPLLARGGLACIGATTPAEWDQMLQRDPALGRRFMVIEVPEPDSAETLAMLHTLRPRLQAHHGLRIADESLTWALEHSQARPGRMPDKAVDLLDEACAAFRQSRTHCVSDEYKAAQTSLVAAREAFDLEAYAKLRHCVIPALQLPVDACLDLACLESLAALKPS